MTISERPRSALAWIWRPDRPLLPSRRRLWSTIWRYGQIPLAIGAAFAGANGYHGRYDGWSGYVRAGFIVTPGLVSFIVAAITAIPLLLVARRSLLAWGVSASTAFLFGAYLPVPGSDLSVWPWSPVQPLIMLPVSFVVGLRHRIPVLVAVWFATMAVLMTTVHENQAGISLLFTLPLVIGGIIGRNFKLGQRLAAEQERGGVLTERARIARELHDVVAHHMSMIAVRAETAPYRLSGVDEDTRTEFTEISAAARGALTEMRLLLGVLRSDETTPPPTTPQPQITDLPDLVESARHAGATVELAVDDSVGEVPSIVGVSAYRIVQEALSNVARHAPGAVARVTLRVEGDMLCVRVANGPGTRPSAGGGSGYGLKGATERATILGGSLDAGATGDGGYAVEARLPIGEVE